MNDLEEYRRKRKFDSTPEPKDLSVRATEERFVVHYHQSRRPHYDLRLAHRGVLKSWAIPKGPSLNPEEKHLAVQVEDHPYDYKDFEGTIPEGNYGAGTVMIWDEGFYRPLIRESFERDLEKGHLTFLLAGQKLKGEFALIQLRKSGAENWILIKAKDEFADKKITGEGRSARSGRDMGEIKESDNRRIKPMMATLVSAPFDDDQWTFEIKWDGFRALAEIEDGRVDLYSRNLKSLNERFPSIVESLSKKAAGEMVLDGEIVALDEKGKPSFQALAEDSTRPLIYYVFDVLSLRKKDLTKEPLEKRRQALKDIIKKFPKNVVYSDAVEARGVAFYQAAKEKGLEGIMAKKRGSLYYPGKRSKEWLKIKIIQTQEVIIAGYTEGKDARAFGALVLGVNEKDQLRYVGRVGTGFGARAMAGLMTRMKGLERTEPVFKELGKAQEITWIKPVLVGQIKFQEWTKEGHLRQPVFLGLREDKEPKEVQREVA